MLLLLVEKKGAIILVAMLKLSLKRSSFETHMMSYVLCLSIYDLRKRGKVNLNFCVAELP